MLLILLMFADIYIHLTHVIHISIHILHIYLHVFVSPLFFGYIFTPSPPQQSDAVKSEGFFLWLLFLVRAVDSRCQLGKVYKAGFMVGNWDSGGCQVMFGMCVVCFR